MRFKASDTEKAYYTSTHYLFTVMNLAELPIAPVTRLLRDAGAERVSEDASQELVWQRRAI